MISVNISPEFVLAAVNSETTKARKASAELRRLNDIGFMHSQTGLDVATEVKMHLTKAYDLLNMVDFPGIKETQAEIVATIDRQNVIIRMIELSL